MNARTETFKALLFLDAIFAQHAADETMKWEVGWHRLRQFSRLNYTVRVAKGALHDDAAPAAENWPILRD